MISVTRNIQLENNRVVRLSISISPINLTNQPATPRSIRLVEDVVLILEPSELPRLGGIETHDRSIIITVRVSHHSRLIFVTPCFVGMMQGKVVSNLVHLGGGVSTPFITVNAPPSWKTGIGNSAHCSRRQTIHDVVSEVLGCSTERVGKCSPNVIIHHAICISGGGGNSYCGDTIRNIRSSSTPIRSLDKGQLSITTSIILSCEVDRINTISKDRLR